MSNRRTVRGTSMEELGKVVQEAGVTLKNPGVADVVMPEFPVSPLKNEERRNKIMDWTNNALVWVDEQVRMIAEHLGSSDERTLTRLADDIRVSEEQIVQVAKLAPTPVIREEVNVAIAKAIVERYPKTRSGMVRRTDMLVRIGVLKHATSTTPKAKVVSEFGTRPDGSIGLMNLTSDHPGTSGLMSHLRSMRDEASRRLREETALQIEELKKDATGAFLDVLREGGVALVHVPQNERHPWGVVTVRVMDGSIHPVAGAGKLQRKMEELARLEAAIPAKSLSETRLNLPSEKDPEIWRAKLFFWQILRQAYLYATKDAEGSGSAGAQQSMTAAENEAEARGLAELATISADEFLLELGVGASYLEYQDSWVATLNARTVHFRNIRFLAERNENGQVRVLHCPQRFALLFARCRAFQDPGDSFNGLPYPLGPLFRRMTQKAMEALNAAQASASESVMSEEALQ